MERWVSQYRDSIPATVADSLASRYFNTVGSKEGWTPSDFVSSRMNRRKDQPGVIQQRPEDFMDEEDLRDAEEARKIETSAAFAGLGSTEDTMSRADVMMGLFRVQGETMGTKLLRKMGWKDGQGVGPKVRRKARLDVKTVGDQQSDTFLFAPENVRMISFERKQDKKGLGYQGEPGLRLPGPSHSITSAAPSDDEDGDSIGSLGRPRPKALGPAKKLGSASRGGLGIGILNDTGSDDEDPYEIGPRISYNRVIGGDKKKKKATTAANPAVKKPAFLPNRSALKRVGLSIRRCHDGRLPLEGFVFGQDLDPLTTGINTDVKYPHPAIPPDWKSSKQPKSASGQQGSHLSLADAAKASSLDPQARAALLGEKQLPGKSVFDYLSSSARDRLAAVTGKTNLPEAKGEIPAGYNLSEEERRQQLLNSIPKLEKETAIAAIARGASGPYADNEEKRARYRAYLEFAAGYGQSLPSKPNGMKDDGWLQEFYEFYNCARIFKPMTGLMASRFTTSTSTNNLSSGSKKVDETDLVAKPPGKPTDPTEEAAKMGMFGDMTRSVTDFYPTRLLCKRFGVRPPEHVQPDESEVSRSKTATPGFADYGAESRPASRVDAPLTIEYGIQEEAKSAAPGTVQQTPAPVIDSTRNEALEGHRAGEEVFKAIFGDSDDDED
jgi:G patch domain-containing protein 1